MEVFGGFMVIMTIIGFFIAVIWLVLPFVVFAIKAKVDRSDERLEEIQRQLAVLESRLAERPYPGEIAPGEGVEASHALVHGEGSDG